MAPTLDDVLKPEPEWGPLPKADPVGPASPNGAKMGPPAPDKVPDDWGNDLPPTLDDVIKPKSQWSTAPKADPSSSAPPIGAFMGPAEPNSARPEGDMSYPLARAPGEPIPSPAAGVPGGTIAEDVAEQNRQQNANGQGPQNLGDESPQNPQQEDKSDDPNSFESTLKSMRIITHRHWTRVTTRPKIRPRPLPPYPSPEARLLMPGLRFSARATATRNHVRSRPILRRRHQIPGLIPRC